LTPASSEKSYASLLKYYSDIFFTFDCVFANSFKTQTLFQAHFPDANYRVLTLTHAGISRQFHVRSDTSHLNIGYMGGSSEYKGYSTLLGAIKLLEEAGFREENWTVYMFGGNFPAQLDDKHLKYMGWFDDEKENSVWDSVDLLIVPSQCFETFGFVVLESLSNGIPVICSDLVGASALAQSIDPCMVFQHNDKNDLCQKMQIFFKIENYLLIKKEIDAAKIQTDMYKHAEEVISAYEDVVRWNIKKT
jgi:glycosyltransferase involved in cell wall biosynthesis